MVEDNWASQLKKIEREFDGLPPEPSPALQKVLSEEERRAKERTLTRAAIFGSSARLILVLALGVALAMWPYSRACGSGWFGYVGVEGVVIVGGLWVAITTWRARLAKLHVLSLLTALAGLALVAAEVLPRIGYAVTDPLHPPVIWCAEPTNTPRTTTMLERRAQYASQSVSARWQESSGDLIKRIRPQQAALERALQRELRVR